jgi:DNA-binding transcriptional LysR family regulator
VLLMHALLAGQGIALGPDLMFEPYLRTRRIRVVLHDDVPGPTGLYAVFPPGRFPSASRLAFMDFLAAELRIPATAGIRRA